MTGSEKIQLLHSVKLSVLNLDNNVKKKDGKMTARERINHLFDEGSFIETGALIKKSTQNIQDATLASSEGVVTGYGTVDGRLVFVYSQDSNILNGAISQMHAKKIIKIMDLARKAGAMLIGIVDCGGGLLEEGIDLLDSYGRIINKAMEIKEYVPCITLVAGYCTGISATLSQISDFVIMAEKESKLYLQAGQAFGITSDEYGSSKMAMKEGLADLVAPDDQSAIDIVKDLCSYLPDNTLSDPPEIECDDDLNRTSTKLTELFSNDKYSSKEVIEEIVDNNSLIEIKPLYAENVFAGLARINGRSVGFVANKPLIDNGSLTIDAMNKCTDFIDVCNGLNIPIITIVNTNGYKFNANETKKATESILNLNSSYKNASVPKITIVAGKAYGSAYLTMGSSQLGADLSFALPNAEISVINPAGGADIFFSSEITASQNPYEGRKEAEDKFKEIYNNPYVAAAKGMVDDIVDPSELRPILASSLEMLYSKIHMETN